MKEDSLSTKDMLLNIGSMRNKAHSLIGNGKGYEDLLKCILARDFYHDEDIPVPSLKELSEASGVKYGKVRKLIEAIYDDLVMNYEARPVFTFHKFRYELLIRGYSKNKFLSMEVDQLPIMPRVGEEISLPFFSAYLETSHFFVEKISYELEEEVQVVQIWLQAGYYNSYWHYRKDKAKEEHELGLMDFFRLDEFELKEKLKVGLYR
ncbi:hypothetical protein ACSX1A_16475 [Pontibacter sp. MBLB2868]|uniref:hypothetical protein n=1 Tax=Pontibacter sp. MBLB2868 TaxID=3451555 RepID=UPI003F756D15